MATAGQVQNALSRLSNVEFNLKVWRDKEELKRFVSTQIAELKPTVAPPILVSLIERAMKRAQDALDENGRRVSAEMGSDYEAMRDFTVDISLAELQDCYNKLNTEKARIEAQVQQAQAHEGGVQAEVARGAEGQGEEQEGAAEEPAVNMDSQEENEEEVQGDTVPEEEAEEEDEDDDDDEQDQDKEGDPTKAPAKTTALRVRPPVLVEKIAPNEEWPTVWRKLVDSGFRRVKGGKEGADFFASERDLQRYCSKNYGWDMEGYLQRMEDKWSPYAANVGGAAIVTPTKPSKADKSRTRSSAQNKAESSHEQPNSTWTCHRCGNHATKLRCSKCRAWKGGKHPFSKAKSSKSIKSPSKSPVKASKYARKSPVKSVIFTPTATQKKKRLQIFDHPLPKEFDDPAKVGDWTYRQLERILAEYGQPTYSNTALWQRRGSAWSFFSRSQNKVGKIQKHRSRPARMRENRRSNDIDIHPEEISQGLVFEVLRTSSVQGCARRLPRIQNH